MPCSLLAVATLVVVCNNNICPMVAASPVIMRCHLLVPTVVLACRMALVCRPSAVQVVGKLQEALQLVVRDHVRQAVQISN